ncbi:MAG: hypothetical protein ACRD3W_20725, partial [Terriglobales bacterium]
MAAKSPLSDQKQMLNILSQVVSKTRDVRDYEVYKYLAQQRLKLLQKQPGTTAADRYREIQTLAFSCSKHKRYAEAEALLLETLQDLESIHPVPDNVGWCESTLARVYEDSGQLEQAKQYLAKWTQFAKDVHSSQQLTRSLEDYTNFLIKHNMLKEAVPVADEFFKQANSPEEARWRDRKPFGMIARALSDVDVDLANKYFRAAFETEEEQTKFAMNISYGRTVCDWAEMLNKHGRSAEALSVLKEGMAFCRTSKWPDALQRNMPQMVDRYEAYLRAGNRTAEASELRASYEKEMATHKDNLSREHERKLDDAIKNPNVKPVQKVSALTEMAYKAFDDNKCDEGSKFLEEAVKVYEGNAASKDSPRMYDCFQDISDRLSKCARSENSTPLLLRIVKARMVVGFPDPDQGPFHTQCGGRAPVNAFDDLFPPNGYYRAQRQLDPGRESLLKELLSEAKSADNTSTVVFIMSRLSLSSPTDQTSKAAAMEELESWKAKENNPAVLLISMERTADMYMSLKQYDKATEKCKAVIQLAENSDNPKGNRLGQTSVFLDNIAAKLVADNQLATAGILYLDAYKRSLH